MYFFAYYIFSHVALILAAGDLRYYYDTDQTPLTEPLDLRFLQDPEDVESPNIRLRRSVQQQQHQAYEEGGKNNNLTLITTHDTRVLTNGDTAPTVAESDPHNHSDIAHADVAQHPQPTQHPQPAVDVPETTLTSSTNSTITLNSPTSGEIHPQNETSPVDPIMPNEPDLRYPMEVNETMLKDHNISKYYNDTHIYYNSSRLVNDTEVAKSYWVDLSNYPSVVTNPMLSHSHRRASTVPLPFKFPFYGYEIENITIATGGFIYTGDFVHSWLAATQYIAPLMANFDTSLSNDSFIKYGGNATSFTVLWENVSLQDRPKDGNFTFEVTLRSNGDIIFVYKDIPQITADIQDDNHPVKVGVSDAYIMDRTIFFVRRKTIFEYHRVHFDKKDLTNWTMIYLKALPTCLDKKSCVSCLAGDTPFNCQWCDNRCSTGVDRMRHDWMKKDCDRKKINDTKYCRINNKLPTAGAHKAAMSDESEHGSSTGIVFLTLITLGLVGMILLWTFYAYRNPHTSSGQILIRYRPSQWSSWRKGEARYTAATIHM